MNVFPLGRLQISIDELLSIGKKAFGRSISIELDSAKVAIDKPSSILTVYASMKQPVNHRNIQENPGNLLEHIFYSFLVNCDKETLVEILECLPVATHSAKVLNGSYLVILSGTLMQWTSALVAGSSDNCSYNLRQIVTEIWQYLGQEGFVKIFPDYTIRPDQTLKLIE